MHASTLKRFIQTESSSIKRRRVNQNGLTMIYYIVAKTAIALTSTHAGAPDGAGAVSLWTHPRLL